MEEAKQTQSWVAHLLQKAKCKLEAWNSLHGKHRHSLAVPQKVRRRMTLWASESTPRWTLG